MHIVYISREYPPSKRMGGIASYIRNVSEAMVKRGHRITVICASDDTRYSSDTIVNGVNVIRLSGGDFIIPSVERRRFSQLRKFRMLYRFYSYRKKIKNAVLELHQKHPIDIIEIGEYGAEALYIQNCNIPYTIRLHTPTMFDRETCNKVKIRKIGILECFVGMHELSILRKSQHTSSCCASLKDMVIKTFPKMPSNINVIYNPIDPNALFSYTSAESRKSYEILFSGTIAKTKGIGDLIEACKILRNKGVNVNLTIAGKMGSYGEELLNLCKADNLEWCKFTGHIPREQLASYYANCHLVCFPSWWEAFAIVGLESFAAGALVVASNNGGFSELIDDGINGFLVSPKNPQELSNTIEKVLNLSVTERDKITKEAFVKLNNNFSMDAILPQFEKYYQFVINGK